MKFKSVIATLTAFVICCAMLINPAENYTENASATSLDGQISEYQQKLDALEQKEQELQNKLDSTENSIENEIERQAILDEQIKNTFDQITTMEFYISDLENEIAQLDEQIRASEKEISEREEEITKGIDDFGLRLRAMYISGNDTYANVIMGSGDFYDTLMRVELIKRVAAYDDKVLDELVDLKKQQEAEVEALEIKRGEITVKMQEYSTELTNLIAEQDELEALYEESTKSKEELLKWQEEYFKQQAELEAEKDDVEDTLSELEQQKKEEQERLEFEKLQQELLEQQKKEEEEKNNQSNNNQSNNNGPGANGSTSGNISGDTNEVYSGDISKVISMARSMVGGRYVFGGSKPGATDCSGLTMQCYAKIGIKLPHKASQQANYGRSVKYNEMKPGDLIFYGGSSYSSIYHVALYIGDGKIIHAESYATGIVVSYSDTVARYNHITCIKRLVE
ncbi:MAG: C40 family peptidase [Oscillospiraceae bacterium]|nr:C40 family peptidase [Oscillospiraceae bacterium]